MLIIKGIVTIENKEVNDTNEDDKVVSVPNRVAYITVLAAVGALADIAKLIKIVPLKPTKYKTPTANNGKTKSFKIITNNNLASFNTEKLVIPAK